MNVKIMVVDDHPLIRKGVRDAVMREANMIFAGEAATGAEAIRMVQELTPDLVVMDVHLPDLNGIEATRRMLGAQPLLKVIIFSGYTDRVSIDQALHAGACGYLSKTCVLEELVQAINTVLEGKLYLSPEVSVGILEDYRKNLLGTSQPAKALHSNRERRLLQLVAQGRRNKEIAAELSISTKSVETYRSRVMKKLGCTSSAELVRYAIREGIATL